LDSNITDEILTSLVISDVCLDLNDQIPAVDEMETMQQQQPESSNWGWPFGQSQGVFSFVPEQSQDFQSKTNDRGKSAKKTITSKEGREHRGKAVIENRKQSRAEQQWNWRLQKLYANNPEAAEELAPALDEGFKGGTRHNQKTQRRSYHKKQNKTSKKNKRPARKTHYRRK
jgi:hypothetical protein